MDLGQKIARNKGLPIGIRRLGVIAHAATWTRIRLSKRTKVFVHVKPPSVPNNTPGDLGPIWVFWAQGLEQAPPVVKICVESLRAHSGGRNIVVMGAGDVAKWVELPPVFESKRSKMGWTKYANALRLALLIKHGGTWFDATILQTASMPDDVLAEPLVMPNRPHPSRLLSNWFIHARAGHPLLVVWMDALTRYWEEDLHRRPYFQMHYIMEALCGLDAQVDSMMISATRLIEAGPCQSLKRIVKDVDDPTWRSLLAQSWMHKLSHKLDDTSTYMRRLERGALV